MGPVASEDEVRALQRRAEQAIRGAKPRDYVLRLLEQLAATASAESEAACFAHRHLAELRLEESPWQAALHLRRVLAQNADDDIAQALMGLCQALQANFRTAVAAYRRAVSLAPGNPWYNHNLGHLLDVALGASRDALPYLRRAHKLEPTQDEVVASLAHCLGRLAACDEALELARGLVRRNPHAAEHRALLQWLEAGAPASRDATVPGLLSAVAPAPRAGEAAHTAPDPAAREVERLLERVMSSAGSAAADVERARALLRDYARCARLAPGRPAVLAAAVEYALARVDGTVARQRDVASRHGVSVSSLQSRYGALRDALALTPGDPRYARRPRSRDDEQR